MRIQFRAPSLPCPGTSDPFVPSCQLPWVGGGALWRKFKDKMVVLEGKGSRVRKGREKGENKTRL